MPLHPCRRVPSTDVSGYPRPRDWKSTRRGVKMSVESCLTFQLRSGHPPIFDRQRATVFDQRSQVGEITKLTTGMIDRTGEAWMVDLAQHKNNHKNKSRRIFIGPNAQTALLPWLLNEQPDAPIFSPLRVDERQKKRKGKKLPGRVYGRSSLQQTLRRAIDRAGVPSWTLAQLRHSAAVRITDSFGIETTRQVLGHSNVAMSRHYSQGSDSAAKKAAKKIG